MEHNYLSGIVLVARQSLNSDLVVRVLGDSALAVIALEECDSDFNNTVLQTHNPHPS